MLVATKLSTILLNLSARMVYIQRMWNHTGTVLKKMRGCAEKEMPSYLDEFVAGTVQKDFSGGNELYCL